MAIAPTVRYRARRSTAAKDIIRAQALRHFAFHGVSGLDRDGFDDICDHLLIEEAQTGALVACLRFLDFPDGTAIGDSYSAQFYDLSRLSGYPRPMVEVGRFCIAPDHATDPEILRTAWGALTRHVDEQQAAMLFGCSSFRGTDPAPFADPFALMRDRHLAPSQWQPLVKAPEVIRFGEDLHDAPDARQALLKLPPLLRSYLTMGGWVSDHAVVDHALNTLHVFTGLEVQMIPPARARALRAVAAGLVTS